MLNRQCKYIMGIIFNDEKYIKTHKPRHIDDTHILNIVYDIIENAKDERKWHESMCNLEGILDGNIDKHIMEWLDSIDENYFKFTENAEFSTLTFDECYFQYDQWIQSLRKVQERLKTCPYVPVI